MREQSHLDDMRSALREDFERLAERRGEQGLVRSAEERDDGVSAVEEQAEEPPRPRSWLARLISR